MVHCLMSSLHANVAHFMVSTRLQVQAVLRSARHCRLMTQGSWQRNMISYSARCILYQYSFVLQGYVLGPWRNVDLMVIVQVVHGYSPLIQICREAC